MVSLMKVIQRKSLKHGVCRALKIMRKDHRFVLGVGDQVVPNTTVTRVKKVAELVKKYGKFEG